MHKFIFLLSIALFLPSCTLVASVPTTAIGTATLPISTVVNQIPKRYHVSTVIAAGDEVIDLSMDIKCVYEGTSYEIRGIGGWEERWRATPDGAVRKLSNGSTLEYDAPSCKEMSEPHLRMAGKVWVGGKLEYLLITNERPQSEVSRLKHYNQLHPEELPIVVIKHTVTKKSLL